MNIILSLGIPILFIIIAIVAATRCYVIIPPGHVDVATLFGKVLRKPFGQGMHTPVNPFYRWHRYDIREKTHRETVNVPTQDQLQTSIEVAVQYRISEYAAPRVLEETGTASDALDVNLVPKLRSLLREQGKTIQRAEDFFLESTQDHLQANLLEGLREYLPPKGIEVDAILVFDISLPPFIIKAIEAKKQHEQEAEKQKAELDRFRTEQQQKIAEAEAERHAAAEEAKRRTILADAQAYEIKQINKAIGNNINYINLQAMDTLRAIAKDPATKLYFLDGNTPTPLPLLHLSEPSPSENHA